MARKELVIKCEAEGRDKGKHYRLTEMDAHGAEMWAWGLFFALGKSGVEVSPDAMNSGMAGLAGLGLTALARLPMESAAPLLDAMMGCVAFVPDPQRPDGTRNMVASDTEEVKTRLWLRAKVFELHTGFSGLGAKLNLAQAPSQPA